MNVTDMFVSFLPLTQSIFFLLRFSGSGKVADSAAGSPAKDEASPLCLNSSSKKFFFFSVTGEFLHAKKAFIFFLVRLFLQMA